MLGAHLSQGSANEASLHINGLGQSADSGLLEPGLITSSQTSHTQKPQAFFKGRAAVNRLSRVLSAPWPGPEQNCSRAGRLELWSVVWRALETEEGKEKCRGDGCAGLLKSALTLAGLL